MSTTMTREFITPEIAQSYLDKNIVNNRKLNKWNIIKGARDMTAGDWEELGNAIQFDINGNMNDGQNRMHMIKKARDIDPNFKGIFSWVMRGVKLKAALVTDTGKPRTGTNAFDIEFGRHPQNHYRSGIARYIFHYHSFSLDHMESSSISTSELINIYKDDIDEINAAGEYAKFVKAELSYPTVFGFAYWMLTRMSDRGQEFMDKLGTGANLEVGDPIFAFRRSYLSRRHNSTDPQRIYRLALLDAIFRAYIDWMEETPKHKTRYNFTRNRFSKLRKGFYGAAEHVS